MGSRFRLPPEAESGRVGGAFDGAVKASLPEGVEDRPGRVGEVDGGEGIQLHVDIQDTQPGFEKIAVGVHAVIA